jgi:cyanophycinase
MALSLHDEVCRAGSASGGVADPVASAFMSEAQTAAEPAPVPAPEAHGNAALPGRSSPGELALVGGAEWTPGCEPFDSELIGSAAVGEVVVLPTAAAYEHPEKAVETAASYFSRLGVAAKACMVLRREDAEDPAKAGPLRAARFIYISGGSVLHLRSVLKSSLAWEAIVAAWRAGAVLAASSAGAMVLGDTMVDPRGGALTLGLGLVYQLAVLPHASTWPEEKTHRTVRLASKDLRIAAIDERTALIWAPARGWRARGQGQVTVWLEGRPVGLEALAAVSPLVGPAAGPLGPPGSLGPPGPLSVP